MITTEETNKDIENKESADTFAQTCSNVMNEVLEIAIFVLVAVFPLFYHNAYYDILSAKFLCYSRCVVALVVIMFLLALAMSYVDLKKYHGEHIKSFLMKYRPENWRKTFRAADVALLAFWLSAGISTLQSDHIHEAFWGNGGRWSGLFLLTLYVVSSLLISHFWKFSGWLLEVFLASSMIVCLFGITDYFQMDILNFWENASLDESFISTMGNINGFTAYVGMMMGVAAVMFALEKNIWRLIWYYLCLVVSFAAIIIGRSDNAYISLSVVFALLPFVLFKNQEGVTRYLILIATFFGVLQAVNVANQRFADVVLSRSGLFTVIVDFSGFRYLVLLLWVGAVASWIYCKKCKSMKENTEEDCVHALSGNHYQRWWGLFLALAILILCLVLLDANVWGHAGRYAAFSNYLVFDDSWGSYRGGIWREAFELYGSYTPVRKLFGCGPDTLLLFIRDMDISMSNKFVNLFDNAHNVFLQYLLTIGLAGMTTYVAFLCASFRELLQGWGKNPYVLAAFFAAACYVSQSVVNLNNVIVAPMMWLMLSVGRAGCKAP